MKKTRVLVADDHAIVRYGLTALLGEESDIEVVGEAADGEEAVRLAKALSPDVVVMDLVMPRLDGVGATARIRAEAPSVRVLVLTSFEAAHKISAALDAGASGALLKTSEDRLLVSALRTVAAGGTSVSPEVEGLLAYNDLPEPLTPRQLDVLRLMAKGLTNKDIAAVLKIRPDGVNEHVIAILSKLGAANRTEAVAIALREQLL